MKQKNNIFFNIIIGVIIISIGQVLVWNIIRKITHNKKVWQTVD